jgi:hypothetical protein
VALDHSQEIYKEIELLSESKIMKARGFNRMYEMGVRVQRTIEKMSRVGVKKLDPIPPHWLLNNENDVKSPLSKRASKPTLLDSSKPLSTIKERAQSINKEEKVTLSPTKSGMISPTPSIGKAADEESKEEDETE